jgi:phosphatidylserine/phosphatidylglycerophosphate/cardiolipin synthase-like enzyme
MPKPEMPPKLYSRQVGDDLSLVFIRALQKAKHSIYLTMYGISDQTLLQTLVRREQDGVSMRLYYDPKGTKDLTSLFRGGDVTPIALSGLLHQKVLVVDHSMVFLGSSNFTQASLLHHDNLVIGLQSPKLAQFLEAKGPTAPGHLQTLVGGQLVDLWLSPDSKGQALAALKRQIRMAQKSIVCALFTFTHPVLEEALIEAHQRGIQILVLIDRYAALGSSLSTVQRLEKEGIQVVQSVGKKLLHHKMALFDDHTLVMGSANWTKAAFTKNSDCLLMLHHLRPEQLRCVKRLCRQMEREAFRR